MKTFNLTRRHWISTLPFAAAAAAMRLRSQSGPEARFDQLTAEETPILGVCHLGFLPKARKRIVVRGSVASGESVTLLTPAGNTQSVPLVPASAFDLGPGGVADFSDVVTPGTYHATFHG